MVSGDYVLPVLTLSNNSLIWADPQLSSNCCPDLNYPCHQVRMNYSPKHHVTYIYVSLLIVCIRLRGVIQYLEFDFIAKVFVHNRSNS